MAVAEGRRRREGTEVVRAREELYNVRSLCSFASSKDQAFLAWPSPSCRRVRARGSLSKAPGRRCCASFPSSLIKITRALAARQFPTGSRFITWNAFAITRRESQVCRSGDYNIFDEMKHAESEMQSPSLISASRS